MSRIVAYTSCSINYLAKARVFARSLKHYSPQAIVALCLNDKIPLWFNVDDEPFDLVLHPSDYADIEFTEQWIFKHDVMELCTSVKGMALDFLMQRYDADLYLYFDPDCFLVDSVEMIDDYLGEASVGVTPHILAPEDTVEGILSTEVSVLKHGVYNLGFLAVRPDENARTFVRWWKERLINYCYVEPENGLFTDQRWVDLAVAIFPFIKILRNPNLNLASWNFYNRRVEINEDHQFSVDGHPLIFYHFSGITNGAHSMMRDKFASDSYALAELERIYEKAIFENGQSEVEKYPFAYDFYDNGEKIHPHHRKLYRDNTDLRTAFPNPFQLAPGGDSFWHWTVSNTPAVTPASDHTLKKPLEEIVSALFDESYYMAFYPQVGESLEKGVYESAQHHYFEEGWILGYQPSFFFDPTFYWYQVKELDIYLLEKGFRKRSPLHHFAEVGLQRGYRPSRFFSNSWYELSYSDVKRAIHTGGLSCGFEHYIRFGAAEGRSPGPEFDEQLYLEANPDVMKAVKQKKVLCGYAHYLMNGAYEGRDLRQG